MTHNEQSATTVRPWGTYQLIDSGDGYRAKRLEVTVGQRTPYQSHRHRDEYWIVTSGKARVILDGRIGIWNKGELIVVPRGTKHQIMNASKRTLVLIEVQIGSRLDVSDVLHHDR